MRLGFALGADAVEPDLVPTRDGVLVVRHEPEISGTTDVADHPEFADRRRTIVIDGQAHDGWWTFDFTWEELSTLRAVERLPLLRPASAAHDGEQPILRFSDLLDVLDTVETDAGGPPVLVAEVKHPVEFAGLGYDMAAMLLAELGDRVPAERLVVESFDSGVLVRLAELGLAATTVFLTEEPVDVATLPASIGGVSYAKHLVLADPGLVAAAHQRGLLAYTWTLRPENAFLEPERRTGDPAAWGDWAGEFRAVLDTGVDGVFADQPELVRRVLAGAARSQES